MTCCKDRCTTPTPVCQKPVGRTRCACVSSDPPTVAIVRNAPKAIDSVSLGICPTLAGPVYHVLVNTRSRWVPYRAFADRVEFLPETGADTTEDPGTEDWATGPAVTFAWPADAGMHLAYDRQEKDQISVVLIPDVVLLHEQPLTVVQG